MKKNILMLCGVTSLFMLGSCTMGTTTTSTGSTTTGAVMSGSSDSGTTSTDSTVIAKGSQVSVDYTLRVESGGVMTIVDTSRESDALQMENAQSGRVYQPLPFVVGAGQMLPAFEEALMGLKAGDSKQFTISAEDAYGGAFQSEWVNEELLEPTITQKVNKYETTEVPTTYWTNNSQSVPQVGEAVSDGSVTGTVVSVNNDIVLVKVETNYVQLFGSGFTEVGDTTVVNGNTITLKSIDLDGLTIEIDNSQSPFAGKEIVVGTTAELPSAGSGTTLIRIERIENGKVLLVYPDVPNTHPLAGKELNFDVKIVNVQ